ncbi:hypothetical protein F4561_003778 [Lipingzhangella halophila]|uniref:Uncharacterized protein n=1 Tax=Lipingzhangella halophila TaxID=1783352 RepID=A0A7W7RJ53_9ACTN|nr:hypothetical protein [Lipingzhangella halophila]MBB4932958.1 hypothetical protein [Lipingzhangella halophila]
MTAEDNGRSVEDAPFDPDESRALIERQRDVTMNELAPAWRLLYGVWGAAFLLGYGLLYLQRTVLTAVPPAIAGVGMFLAIVVALTVTTRDDIRVHRGLRGRSALAGARVGWAFLAGFCLVLLTVWRLYRGGAPEPVVALSLASLSLLVIGLVYMVSAAWERQRLRFGLGGWILGADAVALLVGMPHAYLVLALAGGGGFLTAAVFLALRRTDHAARS